MAKLLHTRIKTNNTLNSSIRADERLTLETSAFQIVHGGNSTFNNTFDKTKFSCYDALSNDVVFNNTYIKNEIIAFIPIVCTQSINIANNLEPLSCIIIHQTHYEKSDWSRAFN